MSKRKKQYDDDDGRTIADMSALTPGGGFKGFAPDKKKRQDESEQEERPWEDGFMREERRMYTLGALKAALLIALVFIVGLGLTTAFLLFLWT